MRQHFRTSSRALLGPAPLLYLGLEAVLATHLAVTRVHPPRPELGRNFFAAMLVPLLVVAVGFVRARNATAGRRVAALLLAVAAWGATVAATYPRPTDAATCRTVAAAWWLGAFAVLYAHARVHDGGSRLRLFAYAAVWGAAGQALALALGFLATPGYALSVPALGLSLSAPTLARAACATYAGTCLMELAGEQLRPTLAGRTAAVLLAVLGMLLWQLHVWPVGEAAGLWQWHVFLEQRVGGSPLAAWLAYALSSAVWLGLLGPGPARATAPAGAGRTGRALLTPRVSALVVAACVAALLCAGALVVADFSTEGANRGVIRAQLARLGWLAPDETWRPGEATTASP